MEKKSSNVPIIVAEITRIIIKSIMRAGLKVTKIESTRPQTDSETIIFTSKPHVHPVWMPRRLLRRIS